MPWWSSFPTSSMSRVRTHFCTLVARVNAGVSWPRKYGLNGTIPALTNSRLGSSTSGALGTTVAAALEEGEPTAPDLGGFHVSADPWVEVRVAMGSGRGQSARVTRARLTPGEPRLTGCTTPLLGISNTCIVVLRSSARSFTPMINPSRRGWEAPSAVRARWADPAQRHTARRSVTAPAETPGMYRWAGSCPAAQRWGQSISAPRPRRRLGLDLGEVAGLKVQAALASTPPPASSGDRAAMAAFLRADVLGLPAARGSDSRSGGRSGLGRRRRDGCAPWGRCRATLMSGAAESSAWVGAPGSQIFFLSPYSTILPRYITATWSQKWRTTPRSWATKMKARSSLVARWRAGSSPAPGSTRVEAETGSSAMIGPARPRGRGDADALARWPPENSDG